MKVEKSGGVAVGEGECGETGVELLSRERRSLKMLSVKKEVKLSASELAEVKVGKGEKVKMNEPPVTTVFYLVLF